MRRLNDGQVAYGANWQRAARDFLRDHPLCECPDCKRAEATEGVTPAPATVVDHVTPHKGDPALFWDRSNWRAMTKRCHDRKTAREDGGFGHKLKSEGGGSR